MEGILWMTREGVGEGDGGDPVLGLEGKRSLSSQSQDAKKLGHRGEHHLLLFHIIEVDVQLEWSKHFPFHLNYENGKVKTGPLTTWKTKYIRDKICKK